MESIELIGAVVAIILAMYAWIKKPVEDMKSQILVHEEKHETAKEEISRLRDQQHAIRNTLHVHEGRITKLEKDQ